MKLYTKLWLKLAPKGYVGVEKQEIDELRDGIKYYGTKCAAINETLNRLQSAYHALVDAYEKIGGNEK